MKGGIMPSPIIEQKGTVRTMNFYDALRELFENKRRISRLDWDSNEEYFLLIADGTLGVHHADGKDHILQLRDADALATDYFLLPTIN